MASLLSLSFLPVFLYLLLVILSNEGMSVVNALASQSQMDIVCGMQSKKLANPQVNWNAPEVVRGLALIWKQFQNLTNQDYVYCNVLGNYVILIGASFTQRQCGNGDSFCQGVWGGQPTSSTPNCTAYYCAHNNGSYCRSFWGLGQCLKKKDCSFLCVRFKLNMSATGWDMFSKNFSSDIWAIQDSIFWHKKDYIAALESNKHLLQGKRPLTVSHPSYLQSTLQSTKKQALRTVIKQILGRGQRRRNELMSSQLKRQQTAMAFPSGCDWSVTADCARDCYHLSTGTPCWERYADGSRQCCLCYNTD